ncbi:hypothetical protein BDA96_10G236100 [Sorghum bicolor]|uniref:Uncharacterized protein n=2 Tax=Sorghum bicolor TaxID=4558 RepID=A0A921Q466_SORBI|nr:hypothetical protein BDA96_10G236100 [Sorghum bicolor]OQU76648.1 hypothetical protein SORBI_3010G179750 [Sorghum bicolor]
MFFSHGLSAERLKLGQRISLIPAAAQKNRLRLFYVGCGHCGWQGTNEEMTNQVCSMLGSMMCNAAGDRLSLTYPSLSKSIADFSFLFSSRDCNHECAKLVSRNNLVEWLRVVVD